ncbi:thiol:disulfide interchange protein, partial [Pseudomonas aeruginosa]|nr:thiol:disulfide interchange protein [Pseudomonas aeruginosa]
MRVLILLLMFLLPGLSQAQPGDDLFAPRRAPPTELQPVVKHERITRGRRDPRPVAKSRHLPPGDT